MENKSRLKVFILYFILYRLMDVEDIMWNIADFIIWPVAKTRHLIAFVISKQKNYENKFK